MAVSDSAPPVQANYSATSEPISISALLIQLVNDFGHLLQQYVALLQVEARAQGQRVLQIILYGVAMLVMGHFVILLAAASMVVGFVQLLHYNWLAATGLTLAFFFVVMLACGVFCYERIQSGIALLKAAAEPHNSHHRI